VLVASARARALALASAMSFCGGSCVPTSRQLTSRVRPPQGPRGLKQLQQNLTRRAPGFEQF
jgi:hypothetical protein